MTAISPAPFLQPLTIKLFMNVMVIVMMPQLLGVGQRFMKMEHHSLRLLDHGEIVLQDAKVRKTTIKHIKYFRVKKRTF